MQQIVKVFVILAMYSLMLANERGTLAAGEAPSDPIAPAVFEVSAEITLRGKAIEIRTLDLGTDDGLRKFMGWSRELGELGLFQIEHLPSVHFPKAACALQSFPIQHCRLFSMEGDAVSYLDVDGGVREALIRIGEREYLLVGTDVLGSGGMLFSGRLVDLQTGATSENEIVIHGVMRLLVSPAGKLFIVGTRVDCIGGRCDTYARIVDVNGKFHGDLLGPAALAFISEDEVSGEMVERDPDGQLITVTRVLNLRTGKTQIIWPKAPRPKE